MNIKTKTNFYLALVASVLFVNDSFGQGPPFGARYKIGSAIYHSIDSLSSTSLRTANPLLGKDITNRYIDTDLKTDSITLILRDEKFTAYREQLTFYQKKRKRLPKNNSWDGYYTRRFLKCNRNGRLYARINYLKLLEVSKDSLRVECSMVKVIGNDDTHLQVISSIPKSELNGLFVSESEMFGEISPAIYYSVLAALFGALVIVYITR